MATPRTESHLAENGTSYTENLSFLTSFFNDSGQRLLNISHAALGMQRDRIEETGSFIAFFRSITAATLLLSLALLITAASTMLVQGISTLLARLLNPIALDQIKASALGSDTTGDSAVDAREWPMWLGQGYPPLPPPLALELQSHSDAAAAKAIPKFRNAINTFAASTGDQETSDIMSHYLTWDELIHTTYFVIPRFRKLIAYALTQVEGLRASETFRQDPDYEAVAIWYRQIKDAGVVN